MYYNRKDDRIELSVRELCALALQGGSIDNRMPPKGLYQRANEGREVHSRLRTLRENGEGWGTPGGTPAVPPLLRGSEADLVPPSPAHAADGQPCPVAGYHAEVTLHHVCRCDGVTFSVSGRADGVWYDPAGGCGVEEIKSVTGMAEFYLRSPREADLAQLTCYGYFLCAAKGLSTVVLRLTYACAGREEDAAHTDSMMTAEQLKGAYIALLRMILPRARDLVGRETAVRDTAGKAVFPYPEMRAAQEDMIRECWRDMRAGQTVFAQAPTGIGKTVATLYPAVRCFGEGRCDKIFYLTAKNATRREAVGAVRKINEAGTPVRACVITAREAVCLCESARLDGRRVSAHCNPEICPYAKGYYDRAEAVIGELLADGQTIFTGAYIREAARRRQVCPYELALDLSERCEIVICDYNYLFSPAVSLRRYFGDGIPGTEGHRYIFLVDEAHNLADRARDMYSGALSLRDVCAFQATLQAFEDEAGKGIFPEEDFFADGDGDTRSPRFSAASPDELIGTLSRMASVCAESLVTDGEGVRRGVSLDRREPVELCEAVRNLSALCDRWLKRHLTHPLYAAVDELSVALRTFRTAADYYDRGYVTFTEVEGEDVRVRLVCLDPAGILRPILQKAVARILFSATLTPADYFADILGGDRDSVCVAFDSPFPADHLCVAVCDQISTRYEDRESSYRRVVSYIAATVSARKGHYMVYFPSYAYLEKVYAIFRKKYPTVKTVVQTAGMTHAEREAFIAAFTPDGEDTLIGFCVLGGSFSEGVDLPGRCLIGTVIVGVGIPGLSNERNIMKEYYDERSGGDGGSGDGYAYAYTYPGMNRVLQAAGRVIRRAEDYGVVVLLDDRYMGEPYLHLYPEHWRGMAAVGDATSLYEHLRRFWRAAGADV